MNGTNIPDKKYATKKEFIRAVVSTERLQQGLDYLKEKKLKWQERSDVSVFLEWIKKDIMLEEKVGITEWKMTKGSGAKFLEDEIEDLAENWYFGQCTNARL